MKDHAVFAFVVDDDEEDDNNSKEDTPKGGDIEDDEERNTSTEPAAVATTTIATNEQTKEEQQKQQEITSSSSNNINNNNTDNNAQDDNNSNNANTISVGYMQASELTRATRPMAQRMITQPGAVAIDGPGIIDLEAQQDGEEEGRGGQQRSISSNSEGGSCDGSDEEILLVATLVPPPKPSTTTEDIAGSSAVVEAHPFDFNSREAVKHFLKSRTGCCMVLSILVLVALTVALVVGITTTTTSTSLGTTDTPAVEDDVGDDVDTASTATAPTPVIIYTDPLELYMLPKYSQYAIVNEPNTSAAGMAWKWIQNDPNITTITRERQLQRFAMVTFYYAMNGNTNPWKNNTSWLDYNVHECLWSSKFYQRVAGSTIIYPKVCNEDTLLTQFDLK